MKSSPEKRIVATLLNGLVVKITASFSGHNTFGKRIRLSAKSLPLKPQKRWSLCSLHQLLSFENGKRRWKISQPVLQETGSRIQMELQLSQILAHQPGGNIRYRSYPTSSTSSQWMNLINSVISKCVIQ